MKKRRLFTLALLGAAVIFTSSCSEDEGEAEPLGPSLNVTETLNASTGGAVTTGPDTDLIFAIEARKGENDLKKFEILQNGINLTQPLPESYKGKIYPYSFPNSDDNTYVDTIAFNSGVNVGTTTYTFVVTDGLGKSKSVKFDVSVASATTDLSSPAEFTWTRVAGSDGIGLDQFGLEWTANSTGGFAIIKKDEATKLVNLGTAAWTDLSTQEDLGAAIVAASDLPQYNNVSSGASADYDDVLGVRYNGDDYILNVTNSTVVTNTGGTTITIMGKYKF